MKPVLIFLLALSMHSPLALAVSWHTLKTDAGMTLEADNPHPMVEEKKPGEKDATADKNKKKERKLALWHKTTYLLERQARPGDFFYRSEKTLSEVNCTTRTTKPLERVYYGDDSREVKTVRYPDTDKLVPVVPDTPDEWVFDFACNGARATTATPRTAKKAAAKPSAKSVKSTPQKTAKTAPDKTAPKATKRAEPTKRVTPAKPAVPARPARKA